MELKLGSGAEHDAAFVELEVRRCGQEWVGKT